MALDATFAVLWISGCAWLVLEFFFRTTGEFGTVPHPWQPGLLVAHGIAALLVLFIVGWLVGTHVEARWRIGMKRASGVVLLALTGLLAVSGFAAFYVTADALRASTATIHEVLGVLALLPVLIHWFGARRARR